jgi:murein tripeptide amidase MpaA
VAQVVEYFAYYMLTNSETAEVKGFLDKYDFIFFPIVNPDGESPQPFSLRSRSEF